jgi:hypothetical protein
MIAGENPFKYSDDEQLGILEVKAKIEKVGLWADKNPIPPWIFRNNKRHRQDKPFPPNLQPNPPDCEAPLEGTQRLAILGNRNSKKYHRPDCPSYCSILPRNRERFGSDKEAFSGTMWGYGQLSSNGTR